MVVVAAVMADPDPKFKKFRKGGYRRAYYPRRYYPRQYTYQRSAPVSYSAPQKPKTVVVEKPVYRVIEKPVVKVVEKPVVVYRSQPSHHRTTSGSSQYQQPSFHQTHNQPQSSYSQQPQPSFNQQPQSSYSQQPQPSFNQQSQPLFNQQPQPYSQQNFGEPLPQQNQFPSSVPALAYNQPLNSNPNQGFNNNNQFDSFPQNQGFQGDFN